MSSEHPVLLLGLDGLSFELLRSPLFVEAAPSITALFAQHSQALRSTFPAYTAPAWTSITTGVQPGRHGIVGFSDREGRPVSGASLPVARIWDYVATEGGRSVVLNLPMTHPPQQVGGSFVSGMPVPPGAPYTWPLELAAELESSGYVVDVAVREGARESGATFERLHAMTEARGRIAARLASRETWDLFVVVFVLPDRLGHPWWKQLVPGDDMYDTKRGAAVRRDARPTIEALDRAVGDLLSAVPAGCRVVACSDHGFGPLRADVFFDVVLARAGIVEPATGAVVRRVLAGMGRSALGRLAPDAVRKRARTAVAAANERRAWTTSPYESGVRLADPSLRGEVTDLLLGLRDPDGRRVVREVRTPAELYEGWEPASAPELFCVMEDEAVELHDGMHASDAWVSREQLPWGTHRTEGVVMLPGPSRAEDAKAVDVAPTVLALLGLHAEALDGRSLVEPEAPTTLAEPTVPGDAYAYTPEEEEALLGQLRGLGYVD